MLLTKYFIFTAILLMLMVSNVTSGKLKFVALKRPHHGFVKLKWHTPKLLGLKHGLGHKGFGHGLGLGHGHGFGGFHNSGYEHHQYHTSHYHGGGGGGWWLGK